MDEGLSKILPVPRWLKVEPWMIRVGEALERSLCRYYGLPDDPDHYATGLGALTAHLETYSGVTFVCAPGPKRPSKRVVEAVKVINFKMGPIQRLMSRAVQKIHRFLALQPPLVKIAFYNAYARATDRARWTCGVPGAWEVKTIKIYMCLLMLAPWKRQIRSVKHLHELLSKILGPANLEILNETGQPKTLGQLCRRIDLSFRGRGKPRSAPFVAL